MQEKWFVARPPLPEDRPLHPRHGIHAPTGGTPPRAPGSVRRTSTVDAIRPRGVNGELVLVGRARDLVTPIDGAAFVHAEAAVRAEVDFMNGRALTRIDADPALPGADALLGVPCSTGFRAAVDGIVPQGSERLSPLYLLLDDLPAASLVSGHAVIYAGMFPVQEQAQRLQQPDLCSGWRTGGTILADIDSTGLSPVVTGPLAPSLLNARDPLAWHTFGPLPANSMRRSRRMDVARTEAIEVDMLFRDSHFSFAGVETVIHEYTVHARLEPGSLRIIDIAAEPRALPFVECPEAAASAKRLAGELVAGLRPRIRAEFLGPSTCTHLNDTLRSLEDVRALAALLG
ncbi:MAG: DUF2889 domain-containing protein [Gammaproteobacteria bacterium]